MLLLAIALTLVAAQAPAASIKNTKHDLSKLNNNTGIQIKSDNYDEICIFCHTPHKAITQDNAPLWNRSGTDNIGITSYYNTTTLEPESRRSSVQSNIAQSDVKLCLSCHDGASLTQELANPSNLVAGDQPTGLVEIGSATVPTTAAANIGTDLHNDHPIGMIYNTVTDNNEDEWVLTPIGSIQFYDGGVMWCSSCHDVHDNSAAPFLVTSNAASGLCLSCHKK